MYAALRAATELLRGVRIVGEAWRTMQPDSDDVRGVLSRLGGAMLKCDH